MTIITTMLSLFTACLHNNYILMTMYFWCTRMDSKNIRKKFPGINKVSSAQKCQIVHIFFVRIWYQQKNLTDSNILHTLNFVKTWHISAMTMKKVFMFCIYLCFSIFVNIWSFNFLIIKVIPHSLISQIYSYENNSNTFASY